MNTNERSKQSLHSSYQREFEEHDKALEEFEKPFKEFEYQMNEIDRLEAEFDELMKIPEVKEYEKDFENGFPFPDDPGRYKRHMEMLIRSCGITPEDFYKYINKRASKIKLPY